MIWHLDAGNVCIVNFTIIFELNDAYSSLTFATRSSKQLPKTSVYDCYCFVLFTIVFVLSVLIARFQFCPVSFLLHMNKSKACKIHWKWINPVKVVYLYFSWIFFVTHTQSLKNAGHRDKWCDCKVPVWAILDTAWLHEKCNWMLGCG